MPIFDINFLRTSLTNLEKDELQNHGSGRRRSNLHRLTTERKHRLAETADKEDPAWTSKTERSLAQNKIKFRVVNKIKESQKT
jgi:hypothetical protein